MRYSYGASPVSYFIRRGARGKGRCESYLACCLRYFLLGFIGHKKEAEEIKRQLGAFLQEDLKLELSKTKTLITHARSEAAKFLGYEVTTMQRDTKRSPTTRAHGTKCRSVNGRIGLRVPKDILRSKCEQYMRKGKAVHRKELQNDSDFTI